MIKSMNKFLSVFLIVAMLLVSTATVALADVTVTSSVADDSYIKVGENVVLTFSEAITQENAEKITVTKVGGDETNLVDTVALDDTKVTLAFGDNLEYSTSYKITVPVGVATNEFASYFTTYNKFYRGINKVIVDEDFNDMVANALPTYTVKQDADDIGKITVGDATTVPSDTSVVSVKAVENSYGQVNNVLYATSTNKSNVYLTLENYNGRIASNTAAKVSGVVFSFKFKDIGKNLNDMTLHINGNSNKAATIQNFRITGAGVQKSTTLSDKWHEFSMEVIFNADGSCEFVNVALDGNVIEGTQNLASTIKATDFRYSYLKFTQWSSAKAEIYIDDIKIYEPTAFATTTVSATHTTAQEHNTTKLSFTNPVDKTTLSNITVVDENGNVITPQIKPGNNLKDVVVWMPDLNPNTKYTITVPNTVKDVFANSVTANTFEVTTKGVENPQLVIGNPEISGEIAAGETLTATVALTENTTANNVDVTLAIALYNGIKLVDIETVTESFKKNTTNEEITATLTIPNDIKGNYAARAFVLDNNLNKLANTASK